MCVKSCSVKPFEGHGSEKVPYRWQSPIALLFRPECGNSATVREFLKKVCVHATMPPITLLVANKIPESAINS